MLNMAYESRSPELETFDLLSPSQDFGLRLNPTTGLPTALLRLRNGQVTVTSVDLRLHIATGGDEIVSPMGGFDYTGVTEHQLDAPTVVRRDKGDEGDSVIHTVWTRTGPWTIRMEYKLRSTAPHLAIGVGLHSADTQPNTLRSLKAQLAIDVSNPSEWRLNAPGNMLRADVAVDGLHEPIAIFTPGDTAGSPGFIGLTRQSPAAETVVVWPLSVTELGAVDFEVVDDQALFTVDTQLAAHLSADRGEVMWRALHLDILDGTFAESAPTLHNWWAEAGIASAAESPRWLTHGAIYEVHTGFSVFAGGVRYERYPSLLELHADLDRIQGLGFTTLQLMPQHPYPSYNVHDYADISTTYGNEDDLRKLVQECHRRGMKIIIDIIIHGVLDKEVMDQTLQAALAGPYADQLEDGRLDYTLRTAEDIAWTRHIVEYAPYWREGAVESHPLATEHPDWFMTDSRGVIGRKYTKAFDIANPQWQRYFLDACLNIVERLNIDGFRVDAPTYNEFSTWAPGRPARPSYGPMASLPLLRQLREELKAVRPDIAVYTEPTGGLFRAAADATYNYDEWWVIESLFAPNPKHGNRTLRNGRDLAQWLHDRDSALPLGSRVIHHIDSHDSIWWRLPGQQWRRERFGEEAAAALLAVFAFIGGGYMTFMGGEEGLERQTARALELRNRPELADGVIDYTAPKSTAPEIFTVVRRLGNVATLVAVNLSAVDADCRITVPSIAPYAKLQDLWNDDAVQADSEGALAMRMRPYQVVVISLENGPNNQ